MIYSKLLMVFFSQYFTILWHCLLQQEETDYPHHCFLNYVGHNHSCDLLNTAMIEVMVKFFWSSTSLAGRLKDLYNVFFILKETEEIAGCFETLKVTGWMPIIKVKQTSKTQEADFLNVTGWLIHSYKLHVVVVSDSYAEAFCFAVCLASNFFVS